MSYSAEAVNKRLECPVCLEIFTQPKMLPCKHTLCYKCVEELVQGESLKVQCPECRAEHILPDQGVDGLDDNLIAKDLVTIPAGTKPCTDCELSPGNTDCNHCHAKLCLECRIAHSDKTARIDETQKRIGREIVSEGRLNTSENKSELLQRLKDVLEGMKVEAEKSENIFEDVVAKLNRRKKEIDDTIDIVTKSAEGLEKALAAENVDPNVVFKYLTDQVAECKTSQSLEELNDKITRMYSVVKRLLSDGDDGIFEFVYDRDLVDGLSRFGRFEYGCTSVETLSTQPEMVASGEGVNTSDLSSWDNCETGEDNEFSLIPSPQEQETMDQKKNVEGVGEEGFQSGGASAEGGEGCPSILYHNKNNIDTIVIGATDDPKEELRSPQNAVYSSVDDAIYVADTHRVIAYDADGQNGFVFYDGEEGLNDIAASNDYILLLKDQAIHLIRRDRTVKDTITSFNSQPLQWCTSIHYFHYHIIVLDRGLKAVVFFDKSGQYVRHFQPELNDPRSLAVDKRGRIYIADRGKVICPVSVKVYTWEGEYVTSFGEDESTNRYDIMGICVDNQGFISVTRHYSHRIDVYTPHPDFKFLCSYGKYGDNPSCLRYPRGVRMMRDGKSIVVDTENHRVQLF